MRKTVLALAATLAAGGAHAQDNYIGEIMLVGFNFCPRGTTEANGQLLPISQFTALFSLYGTIYGGDGRTTFALPDLRGRVPVHVGQGPGLSNYLPGQRGGVEAQTLTSQQMPPHQHGVTVTLNGTTAPASSPSPAGNLPALSTGASLYGTIPSGGSPAAMNAAGASVTENNAGGGQPVSTVQPYLALRYCIVLNGLFPPRS